MAEENTTSEKRAAPESKPVTRPAAIVKSEPDKAQSRRHFLEVAGGTALLGGLYGLTFFNNEEMAKPRGIRQVTKDASMPDIVAVEGNPESYGDITERAIQELGGIEKFVKKGDKVVITPNMGWMRTPEQAAATHPDVLRRLVELCERAGASRITCIDYTLDDWKLAFDICGANRAVAGTRAKLLSPTEQTMYKAVDIPAAVPRLLADNTTVYDPRHHFNQIDQHIPHDIIEADAFIVNPVVKDHEAAVITIAMKKLMGCIWNRKDYHRYGLHDCIAELNMFLKPTLIVTDATRALQTRGPKGPGEVTTPHKVIAGIDPVALDSYCCQFLTVKGITPDAVNHLVLANSLGRGQIDTSVMQIKEIAGAKGA